MKRLDNGNIEITLVIPWADIQKGYDKEVQHQVAESELPGFRKGKAPREVVEAKLDKNRIYSQALQEMLPALYTQEVKAHNLKPILYPQVRITKGQEGQDWEVVFVTCEAPVVQLPDYKSEIKKLKLPEILKYLQDKSQVKLPELLVDEEVNHRLAGLAENITRLGITTDAYLVSKKITASDLQKNMRADAIVDLKVEFSLASIQTAEKLSDRQKTLDFLLALV